MHFHKNAYILIFFIIMGQTPSGLEKTEREERRGKNPSVAQQFLGLVTLLSSIRSKKNRVHPFTSSQDTNRSSDENLSTCQPSGLFESSLSYRSQTPRWLEGMDLKESVLSGSWKSESEYSLNSELNLGLDSDSWETISTITMSPVSLLHISHITFTVYCLFGSSLMFLSPFCFSLLNFHACTGQLTGQLQSRNNFLPDTGKPLRKNLKNHVGPSAPGLLISHCFCLAFY